MNCVPINMGNGVTGFVCGRAPHRQPCGSCGKPAMIQWDYPVKRAINPGYPGKTENAPCDRWQCENCATQIGPNVHYCKPHAAMGPPKL